jgi:predicted SPOUT superfamily RNA methylase MTH1
MGRHNRKLAIAIPVSVISGIPHLREKTLEIGLIGRAAAIFRVDEIIIFSDNAGSPNQKRDRALIATLLTYMETPQYLRKRLFEIKPELRYAGILPPLRTPHHPLENRAIKLKTGEHREGAVIAVNKAGALVDIGVEKPALLPNKKLPKNKRVTVTITNAGKPLRAVLANLANINDYWGYTVTPSKGSFGKVAKSGSYDLVIATSKMGVPLTQITEEINQRWKEATNVLVAFGGPSRGLQDILAKEHLILDEVADFTVNTIPNQGTETVRTEEALYVSLALLNALQLKNNFV